MSLTLILVTLDAQKLGGKHLTYSQERELLQESQERKYTKEKVSNLPIIICKDLLVLLSPPGGWADGVCTKFCFT